MDQIIKTLLSESPQPPDFFWYTLSLLLAGALIFVILNYTNKIDKILDRLSTDVVDLKKIVKVHENQIDEARHDIKNLESKVFKK